MTLVFEARCYGEVPREWGVAHEQVSGERIAEEKNLYAPRFSRSHNSKKAAGYVMIKASQKRFMGAYGTQTARPVFRIRLTREQDSFLERVVQGGYWAASRWGGWDEEKNISPMPKMPLSEKYSFSLDEAVMRQVNDLQAVSRDIPNVNTQNKDGDRKSDPIGLPKSQIRNEYVEVVGIAKGKYGVSEEKGVAKTAPSSDPKSDFGEDHSKNNSKIEEIPDQTPSYGIAVQIEGSQSYAKQQEDGSGSAYGNQVQKAPVSDEGVFKQKTREIVHYIGILEEIAAKLRVFIKNPASVGVYRGHYNID